MLERQAAHARTITLLADVAREAVARGCWSDGEAFGEELRAAKAEAERIAGWAGRLAECGNVGLVTACPQGHGARSVAFCCRCPVCPRQMRRRAREWVARAERLTEALENTPEGCAWRLVTLTWAPVGDTRANVQEACDIRRLVWRLVQRRYGARAMFGRVELGEETRSTHVHLHLLVCCPQFIPRDELVRWLRGRHCDVPGCPHPADDRCGPCREHRRGGWGGVPHEPAPGCTRRCGAGHRTYSTTGRRCSGSWSVDVRMVRGNGGLSEALKYITKPVHVPESADAAEWPRHDSHVAARAEIERRARAETVLRFAAAHAGRHMVESYGLARKRELTAESPEDADPEDVHGGAHGLGRCRCGASMAPVTGWQRDARGAMWRINPAQAINRLGLRRLIAPPVPG